MRKLKLELSTLRVDSFEACAARGAEGTVVAHATKRVDTCAPTCATNCDCTLGCNTVPCTTS